MSEDSANKDEIKWGAEIAVDGKRPEWLEDDDTQVWYRCLDGYTCHHPANRLTNDLSWWTRVGHGDQIVAIRLPADHPYYAQEKRKIDPALVERMVALVREVGEVWPAGFERHTKEARDIIKALEPVDSAALQAAKEIAQRRNLLPVNEMEVQNSVIETLMEAIQRGRQLEREETNA